MAEIRFHTLSAAGGLHRFRHACQLTEQAYLAGLRVLVWLDGPADLTQFDQLLWTFGERAFVPHEPLAMDARSSEAPVQLHGGDALTDAAIDGFDILVNLRALPSADALRFPQIEEVLDADPAVRDAGRARFRFYREAGANPRHIAVTGQ